MAMKTLRDTAAAERVLLVGVGWKRAPRVPGVSAGEPERELLLELEELARSAGAQVTGSIFQLRDAPDPATLVGRGKLDEIKIEAQMRHAPLIVFDRNLSPMQQRNIERATECRVIDRTQLILDIFARHARSREGQLQVELAQLNYLLPRLTGRGTEMSRLGGRSGAGGAGGAGSGAGRIGVRGPGEQKLGTVALVGYTNAGKSTLFNALSRADVVVSSKMFATLDPTVRAVRLPSNRRVLLTDTVGFIRDLPPGLIAAFRATLEEVQEAALILHVTDVSSPYHAEQDTEVEKVLGDLGVADRPRLHVFNKTDHLAPEEMTVLTQSPAGGNVFVSALTGWGLEELLRRIDEAMPVDPVVRLDLRVPLSDGRTLALVNALGRVLHSEVRDSHMMLVAEVSESVARRLKLHDLRASA